MADDKIVIDLLGNTKPLARALDSGGESARDFGRDIERYVGNAERVLQETDHSANQLSDTFKIGLAGAIAGVAASAAQLGAQLISTGIKELIRLGPAWIDLANTQIEAEAKLEAVLKATGNAAGFTADQLKTMASQIQTNTRFGDEYVLGLQTVIATFRNVKGDEFARATELSLDMATALGTDAKSAALQLGKALNDPVRGITALSRAGITFSDEQRDVIKALVETGDIAKAQRLILDELADQMGGVAAADAQTFGGRMEQLGNTFGDVGEKLGMALIPVLEELMPVFQAVAALASHFADDMMHLGKAVTTGNKALAENSEATQEWATGVVVAVATTKSMLFDWETSVEAIMLMAKLKVHEFANEVKYAFTDRAPAYLKWLAENWTQIFNDISNYTSTVLGNVGENLQAFFEALKSWLSGDGFNFEFTGLTEGFEASISKLPEIAERELTATEKEMKQRLGEIAIDKALNIVADTQQIQDTLKSVIEGVNTDVDLTPDIKTDYGGGPKEDDENIDAPAARKKNAEKARSRSTPESTVGGIEGLLALNSRISEAAASMSVEGQIRRPAAAATAEQRAEQSQQSFETMTKQLNLLINLGQAIVSGLPLKAQAG